LAAFTNKENAMAPGSKQQQYLTKAKDAEEAAAKARDLEAKNILAQGGRRIPSNGARLQGLVKLHQCRLLGT